MHHSIEVLYKTLERLREHQKMKLLLFLGGIKPRNIPTTVPLTTTLIVTTFEPTATEANIFTTITQPFTNTIKTKEYEYTTAYHSTVAELNTETTTHWFK